MGQIMKAGWLVLAMFIAPAWALPAPALSISDLKALPVVERTPYDEAANAKADVDAAFARARKSHKRVLIDMGGNWCGDCIVLANLMQLPEMKRFLAAHFEIVTVDVGRFDKNLDIPARFGVADKLKSGGVPSIIIAEPDGKMVNKTDLSALEDARHMSPQAIAAWLAQWAK
ncbi:MAG: thioredoxin family protein [Alphaproteobacteria bacterium]|nr:thioredoxin family protein [Alphaproteobacteria bacterium]